MAEQLKVPAQSQIDANIVDLVQREQPKIRVELG